MMIFRFNMNYCTIGLQRKLIMTFVDCNSVYLQDYNYTLVID